MKRRPPQNARNIQYMPHVEGRAAPMLPGTAISDSPFAAPGSGRGTPSRPAASGAGETASFDSLLRNQGQTSTPSRTGKAAPVANDTPEIPSGEMRQAISDGNTPDAQPPAADAEPDGAQAQLQEPSTGGADVPSQTMAETRPDSGDVSDKPVVKAEPALTPEADLAPDAPGSDAASGTSGPVAGEAENINASEDAAPAASPAPAQASEKAAADTNKTGQAAAPQGALQPLPAGTGAGIPASGNTASDTPQPAPATPSAPGLPGTSAGPADTAADLNANTASAEGDEPGLAAARRELENGPVRDGAGTNTAAKAAAADASAKEAPSAGKTAAQPSPATPAPSAPQPPAAAPQSMTAMLAALQSGPQTQSAAEPAIDAQSGEIRLETGSALPARSESAATQAARAGASLAQLRMTPGSAADLGQMIARRFADGSRSFDIRLDPPELGRVQVRLEIGADRSVQAMLTAEKPEALAELQRNARELEKALADAGLDLGENGIGFALSEGGEDSGEPTRDDTQTPEPFETGTTNLTLAPAALPASRYGFLMAGRAGVDMRI